MAGDAKITVRSSNFPGNIGEKAPGLFWLHGSSHFSISSSRFVGNKAGSGAVVLALGSTQVQIDQSVFTSNVACEDGAVILVRGQAHITIQRSQFERNTAFFGGALGALDNATVKMQVSTLTGNRALSGSGGALGAEGSVWRHEWCHTYITCGSCPIACSFVLRLISFVK